LDTRMSMTVAPRRNTSGGSGRLTGRVSAWRSSAPPPPHTHTGAINTAGGNNVPRRAGHERESLLKGLLPVVPDWGQPLKLARASMRYKQKLP
jgi:hypothetical protein